MNPSQQHYATYNPQQQSHANVDAYSMQNGSMSTFLHAWVPPSPQEQQYYDLLFTHVDDQRRNAISGQQAVTFFARSHLDKAILREVWSIADVQRRSELSRNEFYVAMRLISMGQRGEQVSMQRFSQVAAMPYPLPMMEGVPPSSGMQQQPTQSQQSYASQQNYSSMHQQQPGPYALTADEKSKYDVVFQQYDTDRDGFILGSEAVTLFQMSGLDRNVLREIWSMADVTQDSKLNVREFYVAMHLIVCVSKRGLPMPPTLPQELGEAAFGPGGATQSMPGYGSVGSQASALTSLNDDSIQKQQKSAPQLKPQGMSAFDSFSTPADIPLPSLTSSTPQTNSFVADGRDMNNRAGSNGESLATTPMGGFSGIPTPQASDVSSSRARTNSASSVNSISSFTGMAPLPPQPPVKQNSLRNFSSNERIQMPHNLTSEYQTPQETYAGFGNEHFGLHRPVAAAPEQEFMNDKEDKKLVEQLDQLNKQAFHVLSSVERKQSIIEMISEKLQDLDELRHELITLVMKKEDMRSSLAITPAAGEDAAENQVKLALQRSLQSLLENQKEVVQQLQRDISRHEDELEEAILSAKLQKKVSLESRPSSNANGSSPVSTHEFVGASRSGSKAYISAPLVLDDTSLLSTPVATPSAPSISAFSPNTTDNSGFNAFGNFDSAPRSAVSATPSSTAELQSNSLISPTPSFSQTAHTDDTFNAFGDFSAADVTTSVLTDVSEPRAKSPDSVTANDNTKFDAFGTAPASLETHVRPLSQPEASFSPYPLSPPTTGTDEFGISGFGDFNEAQSPGGAGTSEHSLHLTTASPAAANPSLKVDYCDSVDTAAKTTAFESSPFLTPSAVENMDFDAFAAAPMPTDTAATLLNTRVATEKLLFSPLAADSSRPDVFDNVTAATNDVVTTSGLTETTGNLLFSPTFASAAAPTKSSVDGIDDFGPPSNLTETSISASVPESTSESLPISSVATNINDFDGFGGFDSLSASVEFAPSSNALENLTEGSVDSPFSPVAGKNSSSNFVAFGNFNSAPVSNGSTAEVPMATNSSGHPSFSPVADVNIGSGNLEASEKSDTVTAGTIAVQTATKTSDSTPFSPTSDGARRSGGFDNFSSAPTATSLHLKSTEEVFPVDTTEQVVFEDFGDFNTTPASPDEIPSEAAKDSNSFEAFEDFSC